MAFRSRVRSINPTAIPFDPVTLRAGTPVLLDTQNNIRVPSDVSRDGSQLAYYSIGERQEDAFVGPINGPLRRVTDDAQRDRAPVFTPTGRSLIFYSNRDGQWEIWAVDTDGGGLHKVLSPPTGANFPLVSPAGNALVYSTNTPAAVFQAPFDGMVAGNPRELSGTTTDRGYLQTTGWSPDGRKLAGPLLDRSSSGREIGAAIYDLVSGTLKQISTDRAVTVKWLADSRRVIYFADEGATLVVVDTATLARTVIDVRLPGPSVDEMFAISPDNRTIYYGATRSEADIWIVERR